MPAPIELNQKEIYKKNVCKEDVARFQVNEQLKRKRSVIFDIFRGYFINTYNCQTCSHEYRMIEQFLTLPVPIPNQQEKFKNHYANGGESNAFLEFCCCCCYGSSKKEQKPKKKNDKNYELPQEIFLKDCFKLLSAEETLKGDNKFFCEICNHMTDAVKKNKVWQAPGILTATLQKYKSGKINDFISYPVKNLDISDQVCE